MVTRFDNGVEMIRIVIWIKIHGSCGVRYEGSEGWARDGHDKPDVSSPALLKEYDKCSMITARTQRPMNHWRFSGLHHFPSSAC